MSETDKNIVYPEPKLTEVDKEKNDALPPMIEMDPRKKEIERIKSDIKKELASKSVGKPPPPPRKAIIKDWSEVKPCFIGAIKNKETLAKLYCLPKIPGQILFCLAILAGDQMTNYLVISRPGHVFRSYVSKTLENRMKLKGNVVTGTLLPGDLNLTETSFQELRTMIEQGKIMETIALPLSLWLKEENPED